MSWEIISVLIIKKHPKKWKYIKSVLKLFQHLIWTVAQLGRNMAWLRVRMWQKNVYIDIYFSKLAFCGKIHTVKSQDLQLGIGSSTVRLNHRRQKQKKKKNYIWSLSISLIRIIFAIQAYNPSQINISSPFHLHFSAFGLHWGGEKWDTHTPLRSQDMVHFQNLIISLVKFGLTSNF